jgi:hypothetical protein
MQATLAMVGSVAGIIAWRANAGAEWLTGSLVLFFVVPFTFAAIMPTNKRLLDPGLDRASVEAQLLLVRWGRLHAGRGLAGAVSFVIFVWAARS